MGQRDSPFVPLCKRARDVQSRRGPFVRSGAALGSSPPAAPPRLLAASRRHGARRRAPFASACYFAASPTSPAAARFLRR